VGTPWRGTTLFMQGLYQSGSHCLRLEHTSLYTMDSIRCDDHKKGLRITCKRTQCERCKNDNYWQLELTIGANKGRGRHSRNKYADTAYARDDTAHLRLQIRNRGRNLARGRGLAVRGGTGVVICRDDRASVFCVDTLPEARLPDASENNGRSKCLRL